jgi:dihydrofolate reductase
MRKLSYSMTVSLDGYIAGPDGAIDWTVPDEELFLFHAQQIQEAGVHLCGRRLYETTVYWETAEESPLVAEHVKFAQIWKALPKVVFSTTLESVVGNTRLARDGVSEEVSRLKEQPGKDIAVGGAGLARACMKLELIDEWRAVRQPGPTRRRHALLPDPGRKDQPGVDRDEDVWLSRRLPSLQARARRPVGDRPPLAHRRDRRQESGRSGGRPIADMMSRTLLRNFRSLA